MAHVEERPPSGAPEPKGPRMTVPQVPQPAPAAVGPIGKWMGFHPEWQRHLEIHANGAFDASPRGIGTWTFDGRHLTLSWHANMPKDILTLQSDGTFYRLNPKGSFTLRRC